MPEGTSPEAPPVPIKSPPSLPYRWARAFGAFWWDFLVGDTPELLIGALLAIGVVAALAKGFSVNAGAVAALPVLVVLLLGASLYRARRAKH